MSSPLTIQLPRQPVGVRITMVDGPSGADESVGSVADELRRDERLAAMLDAQRQELSAQQADLAKTRAALDAGLEQISALREEMIREAESQLVDLALDVARKVLMQEIQAGRYEIEPIPFSTMTEPTIRR